MKVRDALYDLEPSSPVLAGGVLLFCMDQKSNQKNLAPLKKGDGKPLAKRGKVEQAQGQYGPDRNPQLEID
jgi:hypothetical protein